VNFINNSTGANHYLWDFGDGNTSNAINPVHTYSNVGQYNVTLTAYNGICSSTLVMTNYIGVHSITAQFNFTQSSLCFPLTASFTDITGNSVWWYWRFGDNSVSSSQNPSHTYTSIPTDSIRLTVRDIYGCTSNTVAAITYFRANFSATGLTGCVPLATQFNNNSPGSTAWLWNFGDGDTSTAQNPLHTYNTSGSFTVTLIATSTSGCTDTIIMPNYISVIQPQANFSVPNPTACAPSLVVFNNLSQNAVSWFWDFGDAATSTLQNPTHIYNQPGVYTVSLIVHSSSGCTDTIVKPNYITVLGPITNFTVSSLEGCNPFTASFTDLSQGAVSWQWNFGDGNNTVNQNPNHTYTDTGSFIITLITWDSFGCSSYFTLPQPVVVHPKPQASFTVSVLSGCSPVTVSFTNASTGYDNLFWNFGDGNTSTQVNPSHIYTVGGNYVVSLITSTQYGCTDTFNLQQPIIVNQSPVANFIATTQKGCPPLLTSFINQSTNQSGATFFWDFGNSTSSTQVNPPASFINPGFYSVTLIVTNPNGCSDTLVNPNYIQVYDTIPPSISPILSVSVASNTSVAITWMNNTAVDLQAYVLYRLNPITGNYNIIYTDTNISNTNFSLTSTYTDNGLNTLANTYTYKLLTTDRCNYAIPLDSLTAHTTINVSTQTLVNNILVSWNAYGGCPVSSYQIFRSSPFTTPQYIATVSPNTLTYLDTTLDCPYDYSYKIMATDLCGNNYVSYSDTAIGTPVNIYTGQQSTVVRSTVVDNRTILTEWLHPSILPGSVVQYDIYRSTDNINFAHIATVPSQQTDYMDYDVDVQKEN
ncbi:MAG: PKD domain-containing protein, partial [Bacteroidia bacterium]|nr:PKD domain-containing protein [Bacteroidia bacterium]